MNDSSDDYLFALERSPVKDIEIKHILSAALKDRINDRQMYRKGIDLSNYYSGKALTHFVFSQCGGPILGTTTKTVDGLPVPVLGTITFGGGQNVPHQVFCLHKNYLLGTRPKMTAKRLELDIYAQTSIIKSKFIKYHF